MLKPQREIILNQYWTIMNTGQCKNNSIHQTNNNSNIYVLNVAWNSNSGNWSNFEHYFYFYRWWNDTLPSRRHFAAMVLHNESTTVVT